MDSVAGGMKVSLMEMNGGFFQNANSSWADFSECVGWIPWNKAFRVTSSGGGYVLQYTIFIFSAVCQTLLTPV